MLKAFSSKAKYKSQSDGLEHNVLRSLTERRWSGLRK